MLTYKALYKFLDGGHVHGEVLNFPGAITSGRSLDEARDLLASALQDVARPPCSPAKVCRDRSRA